MPYIGNSHVVGDHTSNFKVLDDISSYTATFDGSASAVISTADETIRIINHRFLQGQRVTYNNGGGGNIGGLTSGTAYFVTFNTNHTIKLATSLSNANTNVNINLSSVGSGTSHTLTAAFDGTNTKFKITHSSGSSPNISDATQLQVAINNVIQRPNKNDASFTEGYAVQNRNILFKTAPTSSDIFWGSLIGEAHETFDISDNKVDAFTGDGSTTSFTLSRVPPSINDLDVTLDGVTQHITAYSLIESELTFSAAPANGVAIQVKHIGFAGASTSTVTGFYGRTGNVTLQNGDLLRGDGSLLSGIDATALKDSAGNVKIQALTTGATHTGFSTMQNLRVTGIATFGTSSTVIDGNNNLINVGTALTLGHTQGLQFHTQNLHSAGFEINQINASGIITASQFIGDGSELTGVSGFATALSSDKTSVLSDVFKTHNTFHMGAGSSVTVQSDIGCGNIAFSRLQKIVVGTGATFRVGAGTTFVMDVLNIFNDPND
tara:strand:+ start:4426 stop:5901 length:1476 start_codon:yes stop_codon:yes gene_type:complete